MYLRAEKLEKRYNLVTRINFMAIRAVGSVINDIPIVVTQNHNIPWRAVAPTTANLPSELMALGALRRARYRKLL